MDNPAFSREDEQRVKNDDLKSRLQDLMKKNATKKEEPVIEIEIDPPSAGPKIQSVIINPPKKEPEKTANGNSSTESSAKNWIDYTKREKILYVVFSTLKVILFLILLYLFLISLNFMTIGFTLVTSYTLPAGPTIKFLLANPFAALAIGIIATAIMQNATATTSIAVSMVGAKIIPDVKSAIPIIMGANIGTCVTNALIALSLAGNPDEFKRSFSGATLNDGFNLYTTAVLLFLEIISGMLFELSKVITDALPLSDPASIASANFISAILNPVIDLFIKLDTDAVDRVSNGGNDTQVTLRCCNWQNVTSNVSNPYYLNNTNFTINFFNNTYKPSDFINSSAPFVWVNQTKCMKECDYWCIPMLKAFGDGGTGLFWIILSIIVVIASLFGIVKVLSYLIVGPIATGVRVAVNASFPGKFKWLTEIVLFIIALLATIIVQSSNIVTATLVPLCGMGIVTLQRVYVMTLGSNIGTTFTGILTAFTLPPSALKPSIQLAFVYTFFNLFGVILWLPIRYLRFPKTYARSLGKLAFKYGWFVYVYVLCVYFLIPLVVFGLAVIPYWIGLAIFGIPLILFILFLVVLKVLQWKFSHILPEKLRDFKWLPLWMRSFDPLDKKIQVLANRVRCCRCLKNNEKEPEEPSAFTNALRRMSVVEGLVEEARVFSRRNTLGNMVDSEDEDFYKDTETKLRRRTNPELKNGSNDLNRNANTEL